MAGGIPRRRYAYIEGGRLSIVESFTREQWEFSGGWGAVAHYIDGVTLLFREDDDPENDVLPVIIRRDPENGWAVWAEDLHLFPLPSVPFRFYRRTDIGWDLESEGADIQCHQTIGLRRQEPQEQTT